MKLFLALIGIILSIVNTNAQYFQQEQEEEPIAIFARSSRIPRQGYGGGSSQVEILPVQQMYGQKPIQSLPNYGIDSGLPIGGGASDGYGSPPGPNGIPPKEFQGGFNNGGGYGQQQQLKPQVQVIPIQQGYSGGAQIKPAVQPIQQGYGAGGGYGYNGGPGVGGGKKPHRQPYTYGSGNGISFNNGGGHPHGQGQGSYGAGAQSQGASYAQGSSYGGGQPLQQQKPINQGYGQQPVDSYSQPPVVPEGGGYGPLAPPPQKAPIGYGR